MKTDVIKLALGVAVGIVVAGYFNIVVSKAVEGARCAYYQKDVEAASDGKATLTFGVFEGCQLAPNRG